MNNPLYVLVGTLAAFLLLVFLISVLRQTRTHSSKEQQTQLEIIHQTILEKAAELAHLESQIERKTIDRTVSLTKIEIAVLDNYERCNIRIPVDIIEDLHIQSFNSVKEITDFIENQRSYWKLENTKRLFTRKDVAK